MKWLKLFCLLASIFLSTGGARAGDFPAELKAKQASSNAQDVRDCIIKSYDAHKADPAYFVASANYYWHLSLQTNISTKPAEPGDYPLIDTKTGKEAGSISTSGAVDPSLRKKAVALLTEACQRFPYRLDIGLGLAHLHWEMKEQPQCCATLIEILKYSSANESKLQWKDGGALPAPASEYIPEIMQGYTSRFFRQDTKETDDLCRKLCEKTVQAYPGNPFAYNMLAALSDANGDKKAAIGYLLAAHQKAPKDTIILFNLATTYRSSGDTANAVKYFEQTLASSPDKETKKAAAQALAELRK